MAHNAVIGTTERREVQIKAGGPSVERNYILAALTAALTAGLIMARNAVTKTLHPYDVAQSADIGPGDGTETTFTETLGRLVPGSVSVSDGTEEFTDDGFGILTGDADGSGKVDYETGRIIVTFNAAPGDTVAVTAGWKNAVKGVLLRDVPVTGTEADVVVFGPVNTKELRVGESEPDAAMLDTLDEMGLWPVG